uniref:Uncharacterized protein n=1 Tax=Oryza rufipogon TaxID=4529 RepID=A0A0E0NEW6_ORYRU
MAGLVMTSPMTALETRKLSPPKPYTPSTRLKPCMSFSRGSMVPSSKMARSTWKSST